MIGMIGMLEMIEMIDQVTVVIPNYKTPLLIRRVVEGLLKFHPEVRLLLIDNHSQDASTEYIKEMAGSKYNIKVVLNHVNAGHGAAMHQGVHLSETPLVCFIDSDCIFRHKGILQGMIGLFSDPKVYAVGEVVRVDAGGNTRKEGVPYILPSRMMIDRQKYWKLPPFNHHGAPAVLNIQGAVKAGYVLVHLPKLDKYIHHPGRGLLKGGSHKLFGIPGWHPRKQYLPESAQSAKERLKNARPIILGEWR